MIRSDKYRRWIKLFAFILIMVFFYHNMSWAVGEPSKKWLAPSSIFETRVSHRYVNGYIAQKYREGVVTEGTKIKLGDGTQVDVYLIPGLLQKTGQFGHIGLGMKERRENVIVYKTDERPVIYLDADYGDNQTVRDNERFKVEKWKAQMNILGQRLGLRRPLSPQEMRRWIRDNLTEAVRLLQQWDREASSLEELFKNAKTEGLMPSEEEISKTYEQFDDFNDLNLAAGRFFDFLRRRGRDVNTSQIDSDDSLNQDNSIALVDYIAYRKLFRASGTPEMDIMEVLDDSAEMKRRVERSFDNLVPTNIDFLITRQAPIEQSILELISNASDAVTGRSLPIGRFGMGALQMLAFVIDEDNLPLAAGVHIVVETATVKGQGRKIIFFKGNDNRLYFTPPEKIKKKQKGTTVRIIVPQGIPLSLQNLIQSHLRRRMNLFTKMKVLMNDELLNPLDDHIYLNGDGIQYSYPREDIRVSISENEILVDDTGSGMPDDVIFNKYLIPRLGENEASPNLSDDQIQEQVHVFYKAPPYSKKLAKSHIVFQVSGINIQEVTVEGYNLPNELVIQLPSSTKLTISRDSIEIDESTHKAVKMLAEKIISPGRHPAHQIALINGFMQAVKMLDERNGRIDVYQSLVDTAKDVFVPFLMQEEKLMFPNSLEYHALESPEDTIFIDEDLIYKITPELIPGAIRLTAFEPGTFRKAFLVPFKEGAKVTYLPLGPYLLINQDIYEKLKRMPLLLNLRLNFYVGYGRIRPVKGRILSPREFAQRKDLQASLLLEKYPVLHGTIEQTQMVWINEYAKRNIQDLQRLEGFLTRLNSFLGAIPQDIRDQIKWEDILPFTSVRAGQLKRLLSRQAEMINPDIDFITLHSNYFLNREHPERICRYMTNLMSPDGITQYSGHKIFHHVLSQLDAKALNYIDEETLDTIEEIFETRNLESYEDAFKAINKGLPYVRGDGVKRLLLRWLRIYKNDPRSAESFFQKLGKYYRRKKTPEGSQVEKAHRVVNSQDLPDKPSQYFRAKDTAYQGVHEPTELEKDGNPVFTVMTGNGTIEFHLRDNITGNVERFGVYKLNTSYVPNSVEWTGLQDNEGRYIFITTDRHHTSVFSLDMESGETERITSREHNDFDVRFIKKTSWGEPGKPLFALLEGSRMRFATFDIVTEEIEMDMPFHTAIWDWIHGFEETDLDEKGKPIFILDTERTAYFMTYDPITNHVEKIGEHSKKDVVYSDQLFDYFRHGEYSFYLSIGKEGQVFAFDYDIKKDKPRVIMQSDFSVSGRNIRLFKIEGLHDGEDNPIFASASVNIFGEVVLFSINFNKRVFKEVKRYNVSDLSSNTHFNSFVYDKGSNLLVTGMSEGMYWFDLSGSVDVQTSKAALDKQEVFVPDEFEQAEMTTFKEEEKDEDISSYQTTALKKDGKPVVIIKRGVNIEFQFLDQNANKLSLLGVFKKEKVPGYRGFGQKPQDVQYMGLNSERRAVFASLYRDNYIRIFTLNLETGETRQIKEYESKGAPGVDAQLSALEELDIILPGRKVFSLSSFGTFHFISIDIETGDLQDVSEENEIFQSFIEQLPEKRRDSWEYKQAKSRGKLESERKKPQLSFVTDTGEEISINSFGHSMVWENTVLPVDGDRRMFVSFDKELFTYTIDQNSQEIIVNDRLPGINDVKNIFRLIGLVDENKMPVFVAVHNTGITFFNVNTKTGKIKELFFEPKQDISSVTYDNNSGFLLMGHQEGVIGWRIKDKEVVDAEDSYWDEEWIAPETRTGFAALDQRDDLSGLPPLVRIVARFLKDKNVTFVEEELPDPRDEKWAAESKISKPIPLALMNYLFDRYAKEIINNPRITFKQFMDLVEQSGDVNIQEYRDIIRSAIQGQDKTQRAWVRELIQNARDAMRKERESGKLGKTEGKIDIRNFIHQGNWIYSIRDYAGMNLWQLLRYYFPLDQTSKDHLIDTGNLGQGNYTLFADFDQVFIRTSTGDGTIYEIVIRQDSQLGPVIESWDVLKGKYKGTEIRRIKKIAKSDPQLESLFIQEALENFAGAVRSPQKRIDEGQEPSIRDFEILYNGESFSEDIDITAESNLGDGRGTIAVGRAKDSNRRRVMQDELFIKIPDAEELRFVPQRILNAFERFGWIHISIGREILLNIPRTGYSQRHKFIHRLQMAVLHNIIKTILKDYMERNASLYAMPPDYFNNKNVVDNPNSQEIAEMMFRGEYDKITQDMIEPFIQDPIKFFELASHVPFTSERHNGEINLHRLRELRLEANNIRRAREERTMWEHWGEWHSGPLDKIFAGKTLGSEFLYDFGGEAAIEGKMAEAMPQDKTPKAPAEIDQIATNYFLELSKRVLTPIVGNDMPSLGFFTQDNNVRAHAGRRFGRSVLEWNLAHVKGDIEELFKLSHGPERLREELEISSEDTLIGRFINTLIHESQHLPQFEQPGDHTHHSDETVDNGFSQRVGRALDRILHDVDDFVRLFAPSANQEGKNVTFTAHSEAEYEIDIDMTKMLLDDLASTQFEEDKRYEIRYDASRLSESQQAIIDTYIKLLKERVADPDNILTIPFKDIKRDYIIKVTCRDTNRQILGEGQVNVDIEGELGNYPLRTIGMLNITFAAANVPDKLKSNQVDEYRPLITFIQSQYKDITGNELTILDSIEEMLRVIRKIELPKPEKMELEEVNRLNMLSKQLLISA